MKCIECGSSTEVQREDRTLNLGLPYSVVARDMPVHICPNCGSRYYGILASRATLESLARWIARRPGRLQGSEIRFLRNAMAWSQDQLSHRLGVTVETVSRWENAKKPMGYQSELALRFLVLVGSEIAERLDSEAAPPTRVDVNDKQVVEAA